MSIMSILLDPANAVGRDAAVLPYSTSGLPAAVPRAAGARAGDHDMGVFARPIVRPLTIGGVAH